MTFQFNYPQILLLIILVPLIILCIFQILLVNPRQYDMTKTTWVRRLCMVLLLAVIATSPSLKTYEEFESMTNLSVVFVVDTTGSMSALDGIVEDTENNTLTLGTRLDEVRADINYLIDALPPAKFSAITFNSTASLDLPLTHNLGAIQAWASTLQPEITTYSTGTNLEVPVETISVQINRIYARYPQDKVLLIFMSDGDVTTDSGVEKYQELSSLVYGGAVISYGTQEGAKMQQYRPNLNSTLTTWLNSPTPDGTNTNSNDSVGYIIDPQTGEVAISQSNYAMMKAISENLGVPCIERHNSASIINFAQTVFTREWHSEPIVQKREILNPIVWPFSLVFVILLFWEILILLLFRLSRIGGKK